MWYIAKQLYQKKMDMQVSFKAFDSLIANLIYEASKGESVIDDGIKMRNMLKNLRKLTLRALVKKSLLLIRK